MDDEEIYANVEEPSGAQLNWTRAQSGSGIIYVNEDVCHAVELNEPGATLSGFKESNTVKERSCKAVALTLAPLCLLLLTGLIIFFFMYTNGNSNWEMKMLQLQTNLTEKIHQLQTSYNNLTKENHQLQTSYNNLTKENHQLKDKLEYIPTDVQRKLQALHSDGWTYFAGSFYSLSSMVQTWQEGRNYCLQKDADLVIINSPKEQEFIRSWKKQTWLGLTDTETEGTWKWVDGSLQGRARYWAQSEPNNANGNENCAEINQGGLWNDVPCYSKLYFICEVCLNI